MSEPRKASDVLLELEAEVKTLVGLVRSQDLNIKILSNKLNEVMSAMKQQNAPRPTAEAPAPPKMPPQSLLQNVPLDPERQVPISAEVKLPATSQPDGFRRTSRPETFAGDDVYLGQETPKGGPAPKFPTQLPKQAPPGRSVMDVIVPEAPKPKQQQAQQTQKPGQQQPVVQNAIPVMQRIVDKTGKSIFLADVEIIDAATTQPVFKTRTNGTGKWMASLGVGTYHVTVRKRESGQRDKIEAEQDVYVDGSKSPLELQTMIVR